MKLELTLALAASLTPCVAAQTDAFDPLEGTILETNLDTIRSNPEAYKGLVVQFPIQFCSFGQIQNPFFTRFVPSLYTNFYGWSTSQKIWQRSQYDDVCGTLFISKDSEHLESLYGLKLYDRIMVKGVVRLSLIHISEPTRPY